MRIGGIISFQTDGVLQDARGNFTVRLSTPKKEMIVGADRVHGHKENPQAGMIEGAISNRPDLDLKQLFSMDGDGTITLVAGNGKTYQLRKAVYTGDSELSTEEGEVPVTFEGDCEEIRP